MGASRSPAGRRAKLVLLSCALLLSAFGRAVRQLPTSGILQANKADRQELQAGEAAALIEPTSSRRALPDFSDGDDIHIKNHWALLIAGSNGWWNYRHQADVSHSYQLLREGGLLPEHMVLMVYDDIADNEDNPRRGHIFNRPGGPDVYRGLKGVIDYRGDDVTAKHMLAVLAGDAAAVRGVGSGRVINAGRNDRLFVFYSDHGAPGVLGMPTGDFLYANDLVSTIKHRYKRGGYKELVMYVEACESGSMFEGMLDEDVAAYITTASNASESSWATYCPGMEPSPDPEFSTCLGDLYSVAWMEDSEASDLTKETLEGQYCTVLGRTSQNLTFDMGSHVMQYGTLQMSTEKAGDYLGMKHTGVSSAALNNVKVASQVRRRSLLSGGKRLGMHRTAAAVQDGNAGVAALSSQEQTPEAHGSMYGTVLQRDADLLHFQLKAARAANSEEERWEAQAALQRVVARRRHTDQAARGAASHLLLSPETSVLLVPSLGSTAADLVVAAVQSNAGVETGPKAVAAAAGLEPLVHLLTTGSPGRPTQGVPLVDSWQCLKDMVAEWSRQCGRMDDYSMRHTRFLANLCNAGVPPASLSAALRASSACEVEA